MIPSCAMTAPRQTMLTPRQFRRLLAAGRKYRRPASATRMQKLNLEERHEIRTCRWLQRRRAIESSNSEIARLSRRGALSVSRGGCPALS
jgi:hypothetical protein